ncbi:MAG: sigma-70 family RNA polymerase sigma factor [Bacteroidales bacterium]|nr:sigma-70 family RNA polymerase sigma factor [Bacteroidales bacterium]MDY6002176.1 sigma-70 family RNA polymerase sigma factor [Candidatus Cryptobacteroides sp.]
MPMKKSQEQCSGRCEAQLIAELKGGSQQALRKLYELYVPRLFAFGMKYAKSRQVVEEIIGDTFLWIWKHRDTIRNTDSVQPLLFIRMKSYLINAYRTTVNAPEFKEYTEYSSCLTVDDASQMLEYDDFVRKLRTAIDRLPKTQRKVILLAKGESLSAKEIAKMTGLTEQTVRNQLSLGLKKLKELLGIQYSIALILTAMNFLFWQ